MSRFSSLIEEYERSGHEKVMDLLEELGWKYRSHISKGLIVSFSEPESSKPVEVFIRYCGKDPLDNPVVEFTSNGISIPTDKNSFVILASILLERNSRSVAGHFWGTKVIDGVNTFAIYRILRVSHLEITELKTMVLVIFQEMVEVRKYFRSHGIELQ